MSHNAKFLSVRCRNNDFLFIVSILSFEAARCNAFIVPPVPNTPGFLAPPPRIPGFLPPRPPSLPKPPGLPAPPKPPKPPGFPPPKRPSLFHRFRAGLIIK